MSDSQQIWTVSQVSIAIRQVLENGIKAFWVKGEVSNLTIHSSGHVYFSIKDDQSQVSCTYFKGADYARQLAMKDGMEVEIFGGLTYFGPSGRTQILVKDIRVGGLGRLQIEFEELIFLYPILGFSFFKIFKAFSRSPLGRVKDKLANLPS